jgi:hypothetical protein
MKLVWALAILAVEGVSGPQPPNRDTVAVSASAVRNPAKRS